VKEGGEGCILRRPESFYEGGRAEGLYKHKLYYDAEVKYVGIHPTGAGLLCEQPNGDHILVRCDGTTFLRPPAIGTIITVQHEGIYSSGKLKAAHFMREREDVTWEQVIAEAKLKKQPAAKENDEHQ
jgi:ATP-dependent DNA ligase